MNRSLLTVLLALTLVSFLFGTEEAILIGIMIIIAGLSG